MLYLFCVIYLYSSKIMTKIVYIVLSVYNWEIYLLEQLMSIYYQNYTNRYLIIIDDWSTDSSYDIAKNFITNYCLSKKAKIIKQNNEWTCKAVERWMKEIQRINKWDNYVSLCDDDDIRTRDKLQKQVEYMQKNKECDLSFHDLFVINQDWILINTSLLHNAVPFYKGAPFINTFFDFALWNHVTTTEIMFKSKYLKDIIPISNSWAKDYRIVCIFAYQKRNIQFIDERLWYYRKWHKSIQKQLNKNWLLKSFERDLDMLNLLYKKFNNSKEIKYFIDFHERKISLLKKGCGNLFVLFIMFFRYPKIAIHYFFKYIKSVYKYWVF